jgi:hypothetical protein
VTMVVLEEHNVGFEHSIDGVVFDTFGQLLVLPQFQSSFFACNGKSVVRRSSGFGLEGEDFLPLKSGLAVPDLGDVEASQFIIFRFDFSLEMRSILNNQCPKGSVRLAQSRNHFNRGENDKFVDKFTNFLGFFYLFFKRKYIGGARAVLTSAAENLAQLNCIMKRPAIPFSVSRGTNYVCNQC